MFTGIIQAQGEIIEWQPRGGDVRIRVQTGKLNLTDPKVGAKVGDSIAVNGVCLTAVSIQDRTFEADVSQETLQCSSLQGGRRGDKVNLELALLPTTRLGGHLVSGHVDGVGKVLARQTAGRSERFEFQAPLALMKYIAVKGSVCVDGVSLTVNAVHGDRFEVNIVPHTLAETTIATYAVGTPVNLEVDIIARYLERLIMGGMEQRALPAADRSPIDEALLAEHGFIKSGFIKNGFIK